MVMFLFTGVVNAHSADLPEPGVLPDNPFYFIKSLGEGLKTVFTLGAVAKAERFAYLAEKRLAEADALSEGEEPEKAQKAVEKYEKAVEKAALKATEAKENGREADDILEHISTMILKHQEVLAGVYERVPENAQESIHEAMMTSMHGHESALRAVSGEMENKIRERVEKERVETEQVLQHIRRMGVPIPTTPTRWEVELSSDTND